MKEKSREFPRQVVTPKREMSRLVGFLILNSQLDLAFAASFKTDGILGWISQHLNFPFF